MLIDQPMAQATEPHTQPLEVMVVELQPEAQQPLEEAVAEAAVAQQSLAGAEAEMVL